MKTIADEYQPIPAGVPPWIWYWSVMFVLNLPATFAAWHGSYQNLQLYIEGVEKIRAVNPSSADYAFLQYPSFFVENIPGIAISLGFLTILFPQLRAFYEQRSRNLISPPESKKSLMEICDFIELYAPGLEMKVNTSRPGFVSIYPNGYRKATIAVFSGFTRLWRKNRPEAEAVLLHEIAHYRRGDALFMGPGNFFENAVKLTLLFYVLFVALPYIVLSIQQTSQAVQSLQELDATRRQINEIARSAGLEEQAVPSYFQTIIVSLAIGVWGLLTTTAAFLVRTAASFVVPVACLWAAEFNADYFVGNHPAYKDAILRLLSEPKVKVSWWRRILYRLAHPPDALRRFFLRRRDSYVFMFLLLIFPLALLIRIGVLHIWTFFIYNGIGGASALAGQTTEFTWQNYLSSLIENTRIALTYNPWDWLLMSGLLLIWTGAVRPWERFFTRGRETLLVTSLGESSNATADISAESSNQPKSRFKYYVLAASFTGLLFVTALIWRD